MILACFSFRKYHYVDCFCWWCRPYFTPVLALRVTADTITFINFIEHTYFHISMQTAVPILRPNMCCFDWQRFLSFPPSPLSRCSVYRLAKSELDTWRRLSWIHHTPRCTCIVTWCGRRNNLGRTTWQEDRWYLGEVRWAKGSTWNRQVTTNSFEVLKTLQ